MLALPPPSHPLPLPRPLAPSSLSPFPREILTDPCVRRDERSIANRLAAAEKQDSPSPHTITDPLKPAQDHGNEPSRGAQVDAELQAEDELRLQEKGIKH